MPRIGRCVLGRVLVVVLAAAATAGCTTRLVYNTADFFVARYVDDYVSLDSAQQAGMDRALDALMTWHRGQELPAYAGWLRGVSAALADPAGVTESDVETWRIRVTGFWRATASRMAPELVDLGASLDDAQVDELLGSLAAEQAELVERYDGRTVEARQARRVRMMERFLRRWTGRLSEDQRSRIEAWAREIRPTTELWLANRAGWARELGEALRARDDRRRLAAAVERLFVEPASRWDPEYRAVVEYNLGVTTRFLAAFLDGLDPRQRDRARSRIERLATQLEALAVDS